MTARELIDRIAASPTVFHAVEQTRERLEKNGFTDQTRGIVGGNGFVIRGGSSLIAFRLPESYDPARLCLRIVAAHGDSPCFKWKPEGAKAEPYGGMIRAAWMDRPLELAGCVTVRTEHGLKTRLIRSGRPVAIFPNTAPHLREMNGLTLDPKTDLVPVFGSDGDPLDATGVDRAEIAGTDLFFTVFETGTLFGENDEMIASPRLDDLECVFTGLDGFLNALPPKDAIPVFALFNNEETGSLSYTGAAGTLLRDTLAALIPDPTLRRAALRRSFLISADNAHALHPNHPELYDADNAPTVNGGVVIKSNAAQRYMSDGFSAAVFTEICRRAGVPTQNYANRSDLRGGSTLGNLSEAQVPVRGVDIGAAQWAMHSAYETAGAKDVQYLSDAIGAFYRADFEIDDNELRW